MPNYCNVVILGHLVKDPEFRTSQKGTFWATGTVAYNTKQQDEKKPHFIDFRAFSYSAEDLKAAKKGAPVYLQGRIEQDTWDKDGEKRSKLTLVVERANLLMKQEREPEQKKESPSFDSPF
jgi:single-strand DNA-binding protein